MSDKTIKNKSVQSRVIAVAVLVCFITTSVSLPVSADASSAGSAVLNPLPFSELTIPDELGTITKAVGAQSVAVGDPGKTSVQASSQRTVILIQDAHAVNDAQDKIQKIIAHLQTHHYADVLLVEGAQGRLDPTILRNYPDKNVKQRVISEYLDRAELAGVESAAVLNDTLGRFEGAEDWALYSENFDAYHRAQAEKEGLLDVLSGYEHKLETENAGRINSRLEDFLKRWTGFRSGSVSFLDLLISLQEFSSLAKEGEGFSELKRILDALGYEKSSQTTALEPAVKQMAAEFKQKFANVMDVRDQANFYMNYQKFLTGQSGTGEMLTHLLRLGRKLGKEPRLSPEMRRLLGHTQTLAAIKGNRLFEDLNRFLVMVAMSLAKNSNDASAVERYEKLFILEDLVKLELTHHSISSSMKSGTRSTNFETSFPSSNLQTPDKIKVLNLDDFDLGFLSDFGLSVSDFEKRLQPALDFYRAALERDRVFYERIKAVPESVRTIVLIAGGFHTSGIERLLRENHDSYAVVTPRIKTLTGSENYFRVMNNDLSYQKYLDTTYYDGLIRHAIRKLTEGLGEAEFRQTAKRWRDNLIRDLASQNRITDFGQYSHYLDDLNRVYAERFAKDLKPLTKEDILGVIKKELEKFKSDVLVSLRKQVEGDLPITTAGLQGLEDQKESSGTKPSDIALDIPGSKPSMLSAALALAPKNPTLPAPPRVVPQRTKALIKTKPVVDGVQIQPQAVPEPVKKPSKVVSAGSANKPSHMMGIREKLMILVIAVSGLIPAAAQVATATVSDKHEGAGIQELARKYPDVPKVVSEMMQGPQGDLEGFQKRAEAFLEDGTMLAQGQWFHLLPPEAKVEVAGYLLEGILSAWVGQSYAPDFLQPLVEMVHQNKITVPVEWVQTAIQKKYVLVLLKLFSENLNSEVTFEPAVLDMLRDWGMGDMQGVRDLVRRSVARPWDNDFGINNLSSHFTRDAFRLWGTHENRVGEKELQIVFKELLVKGDRQTIETVWQVWQIRKWPQEGDFFLSFRYLNQNEADFVQLTPEEVKSVLKREPAVLEAIRKGLIEKTLIPLGEQGIWFSLDELSGFIGALVPNPDTSLLAKFFGYLEDSKENGSLRGNVSLLKPLLRAKDRDVLGRVLDFQDIDTARKWWGELLLDPDFVNTGYGYRQARYALLNIDFQNKGAWFTAEDFKPILKPEASGDEEKWVEIALDYLSRARGAGQTLGDITLVEPFLFHQNPEIAKRAWDLLDYPETLWKYFSFSDPNGMSWSTREIILLRESTQLRLPFKFIRPFLLHKNPAIVMRGINLLSESPDLSLGLSEREVLYDRLKDGNDSVVSEILKYMSRVNDAGEQIEPSLPVPSYILDRLLDRAPEIQDLVLKYYGSDIQMDRAKAKGVAQSLLENPDHAETALNSLALDYSDVENEKIVKAFQGLIAGRSRNWGMSNIVKYFTHPDGRVVKLAYQYHGSRSAPPVVSWKEFSINLQSQDPGLVTANLLCIASLKYIGSASFKEVNMEFLQPYFADGNDSKIVSAALQVVRAYRDSIKIDVDGLCSRFLNEQVAPEVLSATIELARVQKYKIPVELLNHALSDSSSALAALRYIEDHGHEDESIKKSLEVSSVFPHLKSSDYEVALLAIKVLAARDWKHGVNFKASDIPDLAELLNRNKKRYEPGSIFLKDFVRYFCSWISRYPQVVPTQELLLGLMPWDANNDVLSMIYRGNIPVDEDFLRAAFDLSYSSIVWPIIYTQKVSVDPDWLIEKLNWIVDETQWEEKNNHITWILEIIRDRPDIPENLDFLKRFLDLNSPVYSPDVTAGALRIIQNRPDIPVDYEFLKRFLDLSHSAYSPAVAVEVLQIIKGRKLDVPWHSFDPLLDYQNPKTTDDVMAATLDVVAENPEIRVSFNSLKNHLVRQEMTKRGNGYNDYTVLAAFRVLQTHLDIPLTFDDLRPYIEDENSMVSTAAIETLSARGIAIPMDSLRKTLGVNFTKENLSEFNVIEIAQASLALGNRYDAVFADLIKKRAAAIPGLDAPYLAELPDIRAALLHNLQGYIDHIKTLDEAGQNQFLNDLVNLLLKWRTAPEVDEREFMGPGVDVLIGKHAEAGKDTEYENLAKKYKVKSVKVITGSTKAKEWKDVKKQYLSAITELSRNRTGLGTIISDGHGGRNHFWLTNGQLGSQLSNELRDPRAVSFLEYAEALVAGQVDQEGDIQLKHLLFVQDACFQADLGERLLNRALNEVANKYGKKIGSYPIYLAASNVDRVGYNYKFVRKLLKLNLPADASLKVEHLLKVDRELNKAKPFYQDPNLKVPVDPDEVRKLLKLPPDFPVKPYLEISYRAVIDDFPKSMEGPMLAMRSEVRQQTVNDAAKEKIERLGARLHQLQRWLVAKMAFGPWRNWMLRFLLKSDRVDIWIAGEEKPRLNRYVAKYEPKTGRVYLFEGYSLVSRLSHVSGATQPEEIYKGKGVELIFGDDDRLYLSVQFHQKVRIFYNDQEIEIPSGNTEPLLVSLTKMNETIAFLKKTVPGFSRWQKALERQELEEARLSFDEALKRAEGSGAFKDGNFDALVYGSSRFEVGIFEKEIDGISKKEIIAKVYNLKTGKLDGILFYPFLVDAWFTAGQGYANDIPVLDSDLPGVALKFWVRPEGVYVSSDADDVVSHPEILEPIPSFQKAGPGVLLPNTAAKIERDGIVPLTAWPDTIHPPFYGNPDEVRNVLEARAEVRSEDGRRPGMMSNVRMIFMAGILYIAMMSSAVAMSPRSFGAFQGGLQTLGWYTGQVDGKDGPRTQSAVRTLQTILRDELGFTGIRVNGRYDDPATKAAIKELQKKFQKLWPSEYFGGVDGVLGEKTAPFFERYQKLRQKARDNIKVYLQQQSAGTKGAPVTSPPNALAKAVAAGPIAIGDVIAPALRSRAEIIKRALKAEKVSRNIALPDRIRIASNEIFSVIEDVYPHLTPAEKAGLHNLVLYATYLESKMGHWKIQRDRRGNPLLIAVGDTQIEIETIGDLIQNYLLARPNRSVATKLAERLGLRTREDLAEVWKKLLEEQDGNEALARKEMGKVISARMLDASAGTSGNSYIMNLFGAMMFVRSRADLAAYSRLDYSAIALAYDRYYRKSPSRTRPERLEEAYGAVSPYFKRSEVRAEGSLPEYGVRDLKLPEKISPNFVMLSPVFNEQDQLPKVVENIKQQKYLKDVIFVDDGSNDRTAEILRASGVYFISFDQNAQKEGALSNALAILRDRYGLPEYFVAIDGDSYLAGENIPAVLEQSIQEMKKGGYVARPIDIEAHLTARSGTLEWLQGIHWYLTMGIRTIYSKISFFPPSLLGGGNIFKTQVFLDAVAKRKFGFAAGDVELNGIISSMGKVAKPLSAVRVRTEVFKKWNDFFKQQRRWARAQLEGTPKWFFAVFLSGLVLFDAFILWNLPAFMALMTVSAVVSVFSATLRYGVMHFQTLASASSIRVRFLRDVVLLSPLLALYETVNMLTMFNVATFQQLRAPKSIRPRTDTTATRSEIRRDEIDANDYGLRRGRPSRDSEEMQKSLADYLSRNQIAEYDADLIAQTLVRMKPRSLELLRDWKVLTAEETRLVVAGDIGKIMISQDMSNPFAQRMRHLLKDYDDRGYTRAQKNVLLSRLIPVDEIDAILDRSSDLNDGIVIEMLDSRFSLIVQMDRATEMAASLRESGIVPSLAWRILIKQGPDQALSWASRAKAVVETIKDAQEVSGQRNAWLMIMNHGIEKVEEAERNGTLNELASARIIPLQTPEALVRSETRGVVPFSVTPVNWEEVFTVKGPLIVEVGIGDGKVLGEESGRYPQRRYIGIDLPFGDPMRKGEDPSLDHLRRDNVRVILHDARQSVAEMFGDGTVDEFRFLFPDPFARFLLSDCSLSQDVLRKLRPGGRVVFITESPSYAEFVDRSLTKQGFNVVREPVEFFDFVDGVTEERNRQLGGIPIEVADYWSRFTNSDDSHITLVQAVKPEIRSELRSGTEISKELRDYAGVVYYPFSLVDLDSVLELRKLMPKARIILNDAFVPGGSELIKDVPEPGDKRAVQDFLQEKFGGVARTMGFSSTVVLPGAVPDTYIISLEWPATPEPQRVPIEYRVGDFYQMQIPEGTGIVYLKLPEYGGVGLENPKLWEKLRAGLQGPEYVIVAPHFDGAPEEGDTFETPGFSKLPDGVKTGLFTNSVFQARRAEIRESPRFDLDKDFHRWIENYWKELRMTFPDLPDSILKPNFYRMYQMVRDEIAPLIKEGDRILEIGVGSGVIISMLAEEVKRRRIPDVRFTGTDIDPDVVKIARRMTQKYKNVEILQAGDLFVPVLGMKFDGVIWNLPWFRDQFNGQEYGPKMVDPGYGVVRRFFREVPDYLTPSGRSVAIFPTEYFSEAAGELARDYVKVASINSQKFEIGLHIFDRMRGKREGFSEDPKIGRARAPEYPDRGRHPSERKELQQQYTREELEEELKDRSHALLAELEKRSELKDYVLGPEFEELAKKLLGIFGDVAGFATRVREAIFPKILAAETVDPELAGILPEAMLALSATLKEVEGNVTIALDISSLAGVIDQFMGIPGEDTSQVNEIGVTGILDGEVRNLLRERGVTLRPVEPKRNFISRNQSQVPYVTGANSLVETLSGVFDPILVDQAETGDVSVTRCRNLFLIVAAIHLADIRTSGKAMSPSEIRDELLRRLNLKEQDALIKIQGRGFIVSSVAVETYLRMQAEKSIQRAA